MRRSGRITPRINAVLEIAEPYLGGKAHVRKIGGGKMLATRSAADKLLFDHGTDRALQPRYTFVDGPNGLKLGTLVDGAERHA